MDIMIEQYERAAMDAWLDGEHAPEPDLDPIGEEHVWFSMRRVGYDADALRSIQGEREPEVHWFG